MFDKVFKLKQNGTSIKTELTAGLTTFMTMAYIIALNPNLLTNFGAEGNALWNGVFLATCIAAFVGMVSMAFIANKPFCLAPGMGLNSFFAVIVSNIAMITSMSYLESFQAPLIIILESKQRTFSPPERTLTFLTPSSPANNIRPRNPRT